MMADIHGGPARDHVRRLACPSYLLRSSQWHEQCDDAVAAATAAGKKVGEALFHLQA
jgi:hypothetical protein